MKLEPHKWIGAFAVAVVIAAVSNLLSGQVMSTEPPTQDAVPIEVVDTPAAAPAATSTASAPTATVPDSVEEASLTTLLAGADLSKAPKLTKICATCHNFDKGGPNKTGPNLWGVVGHKIGANADFKYSNAMAEKGGEWTYENLNIYLTKPKDFVPGTKMAYAGMKKAEDRAAVIAWLRTLSDNPPPLPSE